MKKSLIVLIPGLARETRDSQLVAFVNGIIAASERVLVHELTDEAAPRGVKRLAVGSPEGARELSVAEAYWNDLVPSLTQQPLKTKVIRGFSLLWFWLFSSVWKGVLQRKYMTFGLVLSTLALISWYFGTLLLFAEALMDEGNSTGEDIISRFQAFANGAGWQVWLLTSSLMAFFPVSLLVDMSDFAKRYVTNEPNASGKIALRFEIVMRVREQLLHAVQSGNYTSVTVVGHSFGAVVAVDLLADLPPLGIPVRVVTLGAPVELLAQPAPWLKEDAESLAKRSDLVEWLDITSRGDWFASGASLPKSSKCKKILVESYGTFPDKLAARIHSRYFDHQKVINNILEYSSGYSGPGEVADEQLLNEKNA